MVEIPNIDFIGLGTSIYETILMVATKGWNYIIGLPPELLAIAMLLSVGIVIVTYLSYGGSGWLSSLIMTGAIIGFIFFLFMFFIGGGL